MKRPHASPSPEPEQFRGRDKDERDSHSKRRRVDSEEDASKPPATLERQGGNAPVQRVASDKGHTDAKHGEDTAKMPVPQHQKLNELALDDSNSSEIAAKKAKETQEAEERRLADLAKLERQEQAKAAKDAEEAKDAAEKAARATREKAEEEERKRKETESRLARQAEEEHQKRLEHERARQARLRREQEEQERRRREALPNRLRSAAELIATNNPRAKAHEWLQRFFPLATMTTKQIEPTCDPAVEEERWLPNYQVAPLLATNDLQLSQCMFLPCRFVDRYHANCVDRSKLGETSGYPHPEIGLMEMHSEHPD